MGLGQKETFTGVVKRKRIAIGSKSEHDAIVLDTGNGPALKIRVKGNNAFNDLQLEQFVGKRVRIEGVAGSGIAGILVEKLSDIKVEDPGIKIICRLPRRPPQP